MTHWSVPTSAWTRLREAARVLGLGARLTWRASPLVTLGLVALLGAEAALRPLQLALSRTVIDRVVAGDELLVVALVAGLALAASQVVGPLASLAQSLIGDRLTAYVGEQIIHAANRWSGLARFEDPDFQDDLHRARNRAATGNLDLILYGSRAVLGVLTALSLVVVLAALHPLVPVALILASLPGLASSYEFNNRTGSLIYTQTSEARRLQYSRDVLLTPEPAKDVRLFWLGPFFRHRYDDAFDATALELGRLRRRLTPRVVAHTALGVGAAVAVYLLVVSRVADGRATVGDVVLYGGAASLLHARLMSLGFDIGFLPNVLTFLPSLFRVLDAGHDLPVTDEPVRTPHPLREGVVFQEVSFTYPGRDTPALDRVSLHIRAGECVALVGHNGAGKTTLVKLILRLYDPTRGRILLDGVDLRDLDPAELRRHQSVIFQDFVRFELTAGENIGLGDLTNLGDDARLHEVADEAGASALLDGLPEGLATPVGRQFGGRELSEGEWQKLALARALMRDSDVLVLDEPTAALDVRTEYELYCRFRELTAGRTTVLISHRLSTARMADRIIFLAGGRVQEEGTHEELLAAAGGYARLFRLQASQHLGGEATGTAP